MYSTLNQGKSVIAKRSIRILITKSYKYMTVISKNVYIDKLDNIVNEYNNTHHRTIKMKLVDIKDNRYILTFLRKLMKKTLNSKLVKMLEYQKIKIFLLKDTLQIGLKKFLWLKKLKILFHGHMLLAILMVKKLLEDFMKKKKM